MTDSVVFDPSSPRLGLPLLFVGQAQKEFYVNEAHLRIDALLHGTVEGVLNTPPTAPALGEAWLVGTAPTGEWTGLAGQIAAWQPGGWSFIQPADGMRLLNKATGQDLRRVGSWQSASAPAAPSGGSVVDAEARVAIRQLIDALSSAGVFPAP